MIQGLGLVIACVRTKSATSILFRSREGTRDGIEGRGQGMVIVIKAFSGGARHDDQGYRGGGKA